MLVGMMCFMLIKTPKPLGFGGAVIGKKMFLLPQSVVIIEFLPYVFLRRDTRNPKMKF
jgi:hypothetical protein